MASAGSTNPSPEWVMTFAAGSLIPLLHFFTTIHEAVTSVAY